MLAQVVDESWQGQFSGQLGMLPARVTLSLYFFQETKDKKKLVASLLKLHAYHDPRPEGVYADDGETLIRPKDLSPPACCIIQRHPTKCQETYMDDKGNEKTMMIPTCANVWNSPKILKAKHRSYQLQVIYTALNWWELLNYFRFEDPLYLFYTLK